MVVSCLITITPSRMGAAFSLHLLPNRIEISLFRTFQPMGDAISNPAFIQMTKFGTNIVQLFSLKL